MPESFVTFVKTGKSPSGRTDMWAVMNKAGDEVLAYVAWFAPWRKYCLMTEKGRVFDEKCLDEIGQFIMIETAKHREKSSKDAPITDEDRRTNFGMY